MGLSEYEKQRLENIRRNQALLRELEVPTTTIVQSKSNNTNTPHQLKKHTPKKLEKKKANATPQRVSARIRGISALNIELDEKDLLLKRGGEGDDDNIERRQKIQRVDHLDEKDHANFLQLLGSTRTKKGQEEEEEGDDDDDKPVDPSLQPLQDQYSQLKIRHEWVNVKMTPDRITNCLFHPNKTKLLGIASGVAGHLSFWDIDNKEEDTDEPVIFSYRPTTQNITNLKFSVNDASTLYLSSIDGSFRTFDMNAAKFNDIVLPDKYPITHFDITDNGQVIYFATGNGEIGIHDTRSKDTDTVITLRNQKIGCININPIHTNLMVAASNDRTATIWDIRNLKNKDNDDDDAGYTPLQELTHGFAVTSAFWSPDGKYLSTSCYDDFLRVFDLNKDNLQLDLKKKIRHNCHTGKWVTLFRTVWNENKRFGIDHPHFAIGDLRHLTSIYAAESATKIIDLYDPDRITATPAVNSVHPTLDSLAIISANGSGRAWCWT